MGYCWPHSRHFSPFSRAGTAPAALAGAPELAPGSVRGAQHWLPGFIGPFPSTSLDKLRKLFSCEDGATTGSAGQSLASARAPGNWGLARFVPLRSETARRQRAEPTRTTCQLG